MYHKTTGTSYFSFFNHILLILVALLCFLPLLHLLAQSFSSKEAVNGNLVSFWPIHFNMDAYMKTFTNSNFTGSMQISVMRTILGTLISMFVITTVGYAMSKDFIGRNALMSFSSHHVVFRRTDPLLHPGYRSRAEGYHMGIGSSRCIWSVQSDSDYELL